MFGKILVTAAVILGAYLVIRSRVQRHRASVAVPDPASKEPLSPTRTTSKVIAYGLVATMAAGSLLWLYLDYEAGQEVVRVRIINANTGDVTTYLARRTDVKGRSFVTLDGRPVTLADVDRMELATER